MPKKIIPAIIFIFLISTFSSCSCIYFNTFHNVRKNFNSAEKTRQKDGRETARGMETKQYSTAIEKASKVLERHPNSGYIDDALYIIGTSYYYLGQYEKSARKFRELFANYPESEYISRSRLMHAKAKMQLKEETEAVVIFEEILKKESQKEMKAAAARALGQYYFETKEYDKANIYLKALIDSLGNDADKLQAFNFMADGYYNNYHYAQSLESYESAIKYQPDTVLYYDMMIRMAQCNYFLNDIPEGLERLQTLADDDTYYKSLPEIRLMMAEGYEWDGDIEAAIEMYNKITTESGNKEISAKAYYYLGLIYQYNYEDLGWARSYYTSAYKEFRGSDIYEDATQRASILNMMEKYRKDQTNSENGDSTLVVDSLEQFVIDQIGESSYLLGELFYFDLEKPDSAVKIFEAMIDGYPTSRYVPRALMTLAYIYRSENNDSQGADSLLRRVLRDYPHSDEAQDAIGALGLSGTVADTGYPAHTFVRAEKFFDKFVELDSTRYYYQILADSILADSMRIADSVKVADSIKALDSALPDESLVTEDKELGLSEEKPPEPDQPTVSDLIKAQMEETAIDSILTLDSLWTLDSTWTFDSTWAFDSLWKYDSIFAIDSLWQVDSLPDDSGRIDSALVIDTTLNLDSLFTSDSILTIDSVPALDSTLKVNSGWVLAGAEKTAGEEDSLVHHDYWQEAFEKASEKYSNQQMMLLDSARYYYRWVIDSFPLSDYSVQARYVLLHIYDNYLAPGDSSLIELYGNFVDSFPESPYTELISTEYNIRPVGFKKKKETVKEEEIPDEEQIADQEQQATDTAQGLTAESGFITDEDGNTLPPANEYYLREDVPFVYPMEAVAYNIQDKLYFQIIIDFAGEVKELVLMNETASGELNDRIKRTVENTRFDAAKIPPEMYDSWFYYTYTVVMPKEYQQ